MGNATFRKAGAIYPLERDVLCLQFIILPSQQLPDQQLVLLMCVTAFSCYLCVLKVHLGGGTVFGVGQAQAAAETP